MNLHFAVIGNPIKHSLSPIIHQQFAEQVGITLTYKAIQTNECLFDTTVLHFFQQGGKGLNITSPFKQQAFKMAQAHTARCNQVQAANTLWIHEGIVHADTTDGVGLLRDLSRHVPLHGKHVLLLGAGGAARSIIPSLLATNPEKLTVANRTEARAYALYLDFPEITFCPLSSLGATHYDIIINATSNYLSGNTFVLPSSLLTSSTYCYDLVYSVQESTPFITWAHQQGCAASDGLGMLVEQAAEAFFIWHGIMPNAGQVILKLRRT